MKAILIGALMLVAVTTPAMAETAYMAFDVGQSRAAEGCTDDGSVSYLTLTSCTDTDTAYRFAGGYQLAHNLDLELSYADLGTVTDGKGTLSASPFTAQWVAKAWQVSAIRGIPLNETFSLLVKLAIVQSDIKMTVSGLGGTVVESVSKTNLGLGIGADYSLGDKTSLRLQFEDLGSFGKSDTTGTSKMQLFSMGVAVQF